ncbi:MAG: MarR family transcriptional regulator [Lachnospiraceae bacterium]|nr:MarR family transcriptional regulator [Lachnospiraceae bacterium]
MRERREKDGFCVTQIQHMILRYLDLNREKEVFQKDLEEQFHVSRATISSTLQVMERNGMILRTAVSQDARLKKITPTEKAMAFADMGRRNVEEMEACLGKGMTPEEHRELLRLLRLVRCNLEAENGRICEEALKK